MDYQGIVKLAAFFPGERLFVVVHHLVHRRGSREGLLFRSQVVKHLVALLVDYPEVVVWSHWSQGRDRLQVSVCVQPLVRPVRGLGPGLGLRLVETRIRLVVLMVLLLLVVRRCRRLSIRVEAEQVNYVT